MYNIRKRERRRIPFHTNLILFLTRDLKTIKGQSLQRLISNKEINIVIHAIGKFLFLAFFVLWTDKVFIVLKLLNGVEVHWVRYKEKRTSWRQWWQYLNRNRMLGPRTLCNACGISRCPFSPLISSNTKFIVLFFF